MMKKNLLRFSIIFLSIINTSFTQNSKYPYQLIINGDGFSSFDGKNYHFITLFLNNNTNETLYYQGKDCDNILFDLKNNPYFHLAGDICKNKTYSKIAVPPHRSQKMQIFLTEDKEPDRNVLIHITMKLYRWTDEGKKQQETEKLSGKLSDTIILHYNSKHQSYWPREMAEDINTRENSILPNKNIYLLTNDDKKLYTLTIDESKINRARDTIFKYPRPKKIKIISVPATLHNKSADTLRFYSMSCSWYQFWGTNQRGIGLVDWECFKNIPEIETVPPHQDYKKKIDLIYDPKVKHGTKYRISLSLTKAPNDNNWVWSFLPTAYVRFNKIWSNEITFP